MNDEKSEKLRQFFLNWAAERDRNDMSGYSEIEIEFGCFVAGYEYATSLLTPAAPDAAEQDHSDIIESLEEDVKYGAATRGRRLRTTATGPWHARRREASPPTAFGRPAPGAARPGRSGRYPRGSPRRGWCSLSPPALPPPPLRRAPPGSRSRRPWPWPGPPRTRPPGVR